MASGPPATVLCALPSPKPPNGRSCQARAAEGRWDPDPNPEALDNPSPPPSPVRQRAASRSSGAHAESRARCPGPPPSCSEGEQGCQSRGQTRGLNMSRGGHPDCLAWLPQATAPRWRAPFQEPRPGPVSLGPRPHCLVSAKLPPDGPGGGDWAGRGTEVPSSLGTLPGRGGRLPPRLWEADAA